MLSTEVLNHFAEFFAINFEPEEKIKSLKDNDKTLVIADVHYYFHQKELFKKTIEDNLDAKEIIIVGDWFDFYSKSRYRKTASIDFRKEFREGFNGLKYLSARFDKIYLMLSNHDDRFKKWIFDNVPAEVIEFCYYNIVEDLLATIPNLEIVKQSKDESSRKIGFLWQHKNAVFCHIEKSNAGLLKTVEEISKILPNWESIFGLKDYDAIIQAHNHKSGKARKGNRWLFHIPCLIDINAVAFDYVFSGKIYSDPPALGYMILCGNEKYDFNKSYIVDL